jgi:hypothetical protein
MLQPLTGRALKVTIVLDPTEVASIPTPDGKPRSIVRISVAGRIVSADLNAKSVRKVIATIRENGPENIAVILQGKLTANDEIAEAGLTAQVKINKPPVEQNP